MVKTGEGFYSSLGFAPLPQTFWQRSQITKPADREVICHASAWDIDNLDDIRIKMCTKVNADDFVTIHHELGHNYYQRAYKDQPFLYKNGANDGFHEAIGDTVALVDHARLSGEDRPARPGTRAQRRQGYRPVAPPGDGQGGVPALRPVESTSGAGACSRARSRQPVSGGLGRAAAVNIRRAWCRGRTRRDQVRSGCEIPHPGGRALCALLPGAGAPVPVLQAACDQAGWKGPLHRCSFYGNKEVGKKLNAMLAMGQSKPWPDALQVFTGSREMSGKALVEYFAPLKVWLDQQNKGKPQGW